jgi:hypothetical protein
MTNARYTGRCFCGEVEFEVTGAPAAMWPPCYGLGRSLQTPPVRSNG